MEGGSRRNPDWTRTLESRGGMKKHAAGVHTQILSQRTYVMLIGRHNAVVILICWGAKGG